MTFIYRVLVKKVEVAMLVGNWIAKIVRLYRRFGFEIQIALGASFVMTVVSAALYFLYVSPADNDGFGCEPNIERLRDSFVRNRAHLERILAMVNVDTGFDRISFDFVRGVPDKNLAQTAPDRELTADRWNEYRRLFSSAHLHNGISRSSSGVEFIVGACGQVLSGTAYGYVYTREKPYEVVNKMPENKMRQTIYMHLEGDWYIFVNFS